jgi:hypothetical protein
MGDGLFFILGLIFFFILWMVSGGPTKPISFSGPFITPITNVGQTQSGYGPQVPGGTISAAGVSVGAIAKTSPYAGEVSLSHYVSGTGGTDPSQEYITMQTSVSNAQPVSISGWHLVSTASGMNVTIPDGVPILTLGTVTLQPILVQPNSTVTVTTGYSPVNVSYQENLCTNFLPNQQNYMGCFAAHSGDPSFLSGTWRVFLNKGVRIWKNNGETIELLDNSGKVVDSLSY